MARRRIAVLISGGGSNLQALIDATAQAESAAELVLVLCNNPSAYGMERARRANIPVALVDHRQFAGRPAFEAAVSAALERAAGNLVLMMTDVQLAGNMDGVELAHIARKYNPEMGVIVMSGRPLHQELPDGCQFWAKPWAPLDVIREAERAVHEKRRGDEAQPH